MRPKLKKILKMKTKIKILNNLIIKAIKKKK